MPSNFRSIVVMAALCVALLPVAEARKIKQVPPPAQQPAPPGPPEKVTTVEGITEYRLANGMRVLLFPDASKQTITVNITYLVGSRHENYGETGMAHLLEHMVFKGSTNHKEILTELAAHGARPNGTTSWDRTNYYETFNSSDENLRWALSMEADRMVNSFIAKKDLDSEMTVVRNEFEMGENNPVGVLFKRVLSVAYDWHNYGNMPIGARSDIEGVPIERLQAFYKTYYQPDNAILLVAGKFDEPKTLALVQEYFSPIPRPARALPVLHTVEPVQDGERSITLRREGDTQVAVAAYHTAPGSHEDSAALTILGRVLADAPAGRLYKALVEPGKAAAVFPAQLQLQDASMAGFATQVRDGTPLDPAFNTLIDIIEKPAAKPVTGEEVERARNQILKQIELSLNNSELVGLTLSDWEGMGDWRLMFINRDRLRKVSVDDVNRVWAAYFKASNRTVGKFMPTKSPERVDPPTRPDVVAMVKDYKGDAARAEGEEFDASPANIEARTTRHELPGGLKIAMLPKKTRGGSVFVGLALRFGDLKTLANQGEVPTFATTLLMRGTTKRTRQQLQDEFDRLKARVNVNGWGSGMYVHLETTRENLAAVMPLIAEVLREPAYDAKELDQLRNEMLAGIEQQRSDPGAIASTAYQKATKLYPKGDIRYPDGIDEGIANIKAVTREQVQKFHRDFFGAQPAQFAVVGDVDAAAFEKQVVELFGGWKAPKPFTRGTNDYFDVPAQTKVFETPDKAQAIYIAGMNLNMRDDDPDYPALMFGNYMLGGGFLNSRLLTRIRVKEGLSYGVGSQLGADELDKSGGFSVYAIYAPQNLAKLEQAFKEEIQKALTEGFTADEITQAKSGWIQGRNVERSQDSGLAAKLQHYQFIGRTFAWDADFEKKVQSLTGEQIRAALAKYIDPAKFVVMKAGDFAAAKGAAPVSQQKGSTP